MSPTPAKPGLAVMKALGSRERAPHRRERLVAAKLRVDRQLKLEQLGVEEFDPVNQIG